MNELNKRYVEVFIVSVFSAVASICMEFLLPINPKLCLIAGSGLGAVIGLLITYKMPVFFMEITKLLLKISKEDIRFIVTITIILSILALNIVFGIDSILMPIAILVVIGINRLIDWNNEIEKKYRDDDANRVAEAKRKRRYEESVKAQFKTEDEYIKWKEKIKK